MSEAGTGGETGGEGIDAGIAAIENAVAGSVSMGINDTTGTAFEPGGSIDTAAPGSISKGLGDVTGTAFASRDMGVSDPSAGFYDGLNGVGGGAARDMGLGGQGEAGIDSRGTPPPEKPREQDNGAGLMDTESRRQRNVQRAAAAGVTKNGNEADLLGYTSAKRKDARRTLLGA